MKRILDSDFVYTNAVNTSVARTFARIRKELKAAAMQGNASPFGADSTEPALVAAPVRLLRKAGR